MKRLEIILLLVIIVFFGATAYYFHNKYYRADLPENIAPLESIFSIEVAGPHQLPDEKKLVAEVADTSTASSAVAAYETTPTSIDLVTGKKLSNDLLLWPLNKNPDFWLLRAYVRQQNWQVAAQVIEEALKKPQPWHLRFAFGWFASRIEFIRWLEQKPELIAGQVKDAVSAMVGDFPETFSGKGFALGVGYLASDSEKIMVVPAQSELIASVAAMLLSFVNDSDHFVRCFLRNQIRSQRYCQKLCRSANMLLEPPEISERYAAVDYLYQARLLQMANLGVVSRVSAETLRSDIEENWSLPNLPVCSGHLLTFSRNQWGCPLHESLDVPLEADAEDFIDGAWAVFLLCHPQVNSDTFD
ncbi:MAG: hypothetical protein KKB51_16360 [Candidatus Riflebacteria bacterium]|nr:hypothetical protein [Candidatus Riflebacteria bacterium]